MERVFEAEEARPHFSNRLKTCLQEKRPQLKRDVLTKKLQISPTRLSRLLHGQYRIREREILLLTEILGVKEQDLVTTPGGVLALSVTEGGIGWARLDRTGRLCWGRRDLAKRTLLRAKLLSGGQYLARVLHLEQPDWVVFEKKTRPRRTRELVERLAQVARGREKKLGFHLLDVTLEKIKPRELATSLLKRYPHLGPAMSLKPASRALVYDIKYWRPVLNALLISQKIDERQKEEYL